MPVKLRLKVSGDLEAAIMGLAQRAAGPPAGMTARIAPRIQDFVRKNLISEGSRIGADWPQLKISTKRERTRKGFGEGPRLRRTGRLLRSIRGRGVSLHRAEVTAQGSFKAQILDRRFPFLRLSDADADELTEIFAAELLGDL